MALTGKQPESLARFVGNPRRDMPKGLAFELKDYIALVDLTGRCIREDKAGHIEHALPEILQRLNICPENWLEITKRFTKVFHGAVGHEQVLSDYCEHQHLKRRSNLSICEKLLA